MTFVTRSATPINALHYGMQVIRDQSELRDRLRGAIREIPLGPRTRFAPSPTGYLHLGHVVNAIFVWGIAQCREGQVIFRMEDHDRQRWRLEHETGIIDEITWLGFTPHEGFETNTANISSNFRQSDCNERYANHLNSLSTRNLLYPCTCTRKEIQSAQNSPNTEPRYPGTCRHRTTAPDPQDQHTLRAKISDTPVPFNDLILGPHEHTPARQCGDISIRDRHGYWTYQFACVCDDIEHNIDLIIRGEDILASTGRQIMLRRLLNQQQTPLFLHHPLILDHTGKKLSKRRFSESVSQMRLQGMTPEEVIGQAAFQCGLTSKPRNLSANDVPELFN